MQITLGALAFASEGRRYMVSRTCERRLIYDVSCDWLCLN